MPLDAPDVLLDMKKMDDTEITAACERLFGNKFIEQDANDGSKKWEALGPEYDRRMAKNYVTWVRSYVDSVEAAAREVASVPANLQRRPVFWTVGSLNQGAEMGQGAWKSNFEVTRAAGLKVDVERLKCLHFPSVTVPEELAGWIEECVGKVKD